MVLHIAEAFATKYFPTKYAVHIAVSILTILVLRAFSQGRKTNRERDLHARVILLTGGFTPLGLTLLQSLAQRGAHVIALSPEPIESPGVAVLVDLIRTTTSNEEIYAEECDLTSPSSIRAFCTKFLTGKDQRLDAIVFAHEHKHIGVPKLFSKRDSSQDQKERDANSLATFLITTLLLPALLVAPAERDIRIINVVNPFYAAAAGLPFSTSFTTTKGEEDDKPVLPRSKSIFFQEGKRSLRTIIFTRHLQRVLDALPHGAQAPKAEEGVSAIPVVSSKLQKSNIVAISASPGIDRADTVSSIFNADFMSPTGSYLGLFLYLVLQPLLRIFTKSPVSAIQTILHVLFLPTPFKILANTTSATQKDPKDKATQQGPLDASVLEMPEEVLLPGALYSNCAAIKLGVKIPEELIDKDRQMRAENAKAKEKSKAKGKGKEDLKEEVLDIEDDGQYGGELAGRLVWEEYEVALKIWEKENPGPVEEGKAKASTAQATSSDSQNPSSEKESVY
ncbi:hypothetical protein CPC08DRAFT_746670 [Agrocybe pediades]|nr:hypothetical protein CPC08DRAFT_746670 [Agrocybe pediades]